MEGTSGALSSGLRLDLPPGFRFHPTDEELVLHYLKKKASSRPLPVPIIAEIDLYKFDPWDLPARATFGEHEWYFFTPRDRKYPNGARPNRAAGSGYWKATGTDKPIVPAGGAQKVGVKKALVFYKGRPPKGVKTNWIMHEYRLVSEDPKKPISFISRRSLRLDDWVLCRIYKKSSHTPRLNTMGSDSSCVEDVLASLPDMEDADASVLPRLDTFGRLMTGVSDATCFDNVIAESGNHATGNFMTQTGDPRNCWNSQAQLDSPGVSNCNTFLKEICQASRCNPPSSLKLDFWRDDGQKNDNVQVSSPLGFQNLFPQLRKIQSKSGGSEAAAMAESSSFRWPFAADGNQKFPNSS